MSVCLLFLFVFFKNSVSFQITDPLINLAEVEQGLLVLRNQHGRPFCLSQGGQFYQQPPPPTSSTVVCSEAPGCRACLLAFLPAGGLSGYLGLGGWSHAQSGLWDMWREPGARGAWDPVICWLESSLGPGSCNLCSAAGSSPCPERCQAGAPVPSGDQACGSLS